MSGHKKIIVIVVTYNGVSCIDYCFGSIKKSTMPVDVLCVDNNSSDDTVLSIKKNYDQVEIVQSNVNLGFGKANNIGLKRCLEGGYDYAFLLNQDARIEPDTIAKLVSIHEGHTDYGILSPVHRSKNDSELDHVFSVYCGSIKTKRLLSDALLNVQLRDVYETSFVNAAMWLVSRSCIKKIKYFDPIFPHYGEDSEYVHRMKKNNMKIGIVPDAVGNHLRYRLDNSEKTNKLSRRLNRNYSRLLMRYKCSDMPTAQRIFYFTRLFMSDLFYHAIMLEFRLFLLTVYNYARLFYDLLVHSIKVKI